MTDLRERAEKKLRQAASQTATIELPSGRVEVWKTTRRMPAKVVAYYVGPDGEALSIGDSWARFEQMLKAARPDPSDIQLMAKLVSLGPGRRLAATQEAFVPEARRAEPWRPERGPEGEYVMYCTETISGRWERLTFKPDGSVQVDDLGPAPRTMIR